jgi:mono/diheme cytochrome c family protein
VIGASLLALALLGLYIAILWEGSSTRARTPWIESTVAQWLLKHTVPRAERNRRNPLSAPDHGDTTAGGGLYRQKCEICHAYDGSGHTEVGEGQYPHPPDLRDAAVQKQSDGELFYHITNGIRHTGMPAWNLPPRRAWELVAYIRHLAIIGSPNSGTPNGTIDLSAAHYVGSKTCAKCHTDIYERWRKPVWPMSFEIRATTRMRSPRT